MSVLRVSTLDQLRAVSAEKLIGLGGHLRVTDDGVFFRKGWKDSILPQDLQHLHHHSERRSSQVRMKSRSYSRQPRRMTTINLPPDLQPLIIGDCGFDASLWSDPVSYWTAPGALRRLKAICQSLNKATALASEYDMSPHTSDEELVPRILDVVNDALVAWPTECIAAGAGRDRGGRGVWRYVFDQEGPLRGEPHHAVDLVYLFDNMPLPDSLRSSTDTDSGQDVWFESFDDSDEEEEALVPVDAQEVVKRDLIGESAVVVDEEWGVAHVDGWAYGRIRDAIQGRWIAFAQGEVPWAEDKVYVFGPEGECGERSECIFEGRRRTHAWKEVLEPLGMSLVQKVGVELSRGPPLSGVKV